MYDSIKISKPKWGGEDFQSKPDLYEEQFDEMVRLYHKELLTFEEIAEKLSIDWWIIKRLFEKHNIPRFTLKERAKLKRGKLYPLIYKLHKQENRSFAEIYKTYGYSPAYCRQILSEGNDG
ncbi:hypothetical protein [Paenibacillus medicaginis]|uniref:HTH araC/xylS-type domain-containing protein n=1 Tax=Paenibacillus medicaginis TaxID=1470560 RepID=A0ABV5BVF5_9BACL